MGSKSHADSDSVGRAYTYTRSDRRAYTHSGSDRRAYTYTGSDRRVYTYTGSKPEPEPGNTYSGAGSSGRSGYGCNTHPDTDCHTFHSAER